MLAPILDRLRLPEQSLIALHSTAWSFLLFDQLVSDPRPPIGETNGGRDRFRGGGTLGVSPSQSLPSFFS
jgi:hypothetical protein